MIVYGSGISDGNRHNHDDLPILLAGKGSGTIKTGRHVRFPRETPLTNLYVAMLDRMGVQVDGVRRQHRAGGWPERLRLRLASGCHSIKAPVFLEAQTCLCIVSTLAPSGRRAWLAASLRWALRHQIDSHHSTHATHAADNGPTTDRPLA